MKRPVDLDYIKYASDLKLRGMDRTNMYDDTAINAMPGGESHPFFFKGDGGYFFKDVSTDWGTGNMKGFYNGAAYADLDNDGRQDMIVNAMNSTALILRNNAPQKNYINFSFEGDSANKTGVGAKVYLFQNGKVQYQQLMLARGFQSSVEPRLHFGLDTISVVDTVLVVWPDQKFQVLKNVKANQFVKVGYTAASGQFNFHTWHKPNPPIFELIQAFQKLQLEAHRKSIPRFQPSVPHPSSAVYPWTEGGHCRCKW